MPSSHEPHPARADQGGQSVDDRPLRNVLSGEDDDGVEEEREVAGDVEGRRTFRPPPSPTPPKSNSDARVLPAVGRHVRALPRAPASV